MSGFTYENQGSISFLIYKLREDEKLDKMALGMMNQNKIPHLLPVSFTQINCERYLRYSGLSLCTLKSLMSGIVTKERILTVFDSICEGILASEEYFLEGSCFVLDADYMYVDSSNGKTNIVYLPILYMEQKTEYTTFFKEIITNIIADPTEDGSYITKILYYLNSADNFSVAEFSKLIKKLKMANISQEIHEIQNSVKSQKLMHEKNKFREKAAKREIQRPVQIQTEKGEHNYAVSSNIEKETPKKQNREDNKEIKNKGKENTEGYSFIIPGKAPMKADVSISVSSKEPADDEKMSMLYLLRNFSGENLKKYRNQKQDNQESKKESEKKSAIKKNQENKKENSKGKRKKETAILTLVSIDTRDPRRFTVNKDIYNIGRRENNDAVMAGLKKVSREHCSIVKENDCYYVIDRNSSFGTIVDGKPCIPGKKSDALHENSIIELPGISLRAEFR